MPKHSPIKYNPNLSIKDNAAKNGCTVGAIRYWLEVNKIDRRAEQTAKIIIKLRECYKDGMTLAMLTKESGYSINTIKKYLPYVTSEIEPSEITEKLKTLTVRQRSDYYATHPSVTNDLLSVEDFSSPILEPCCGGGFMADVIRQKGYEVYATDIVDRGYGVGNVNFLTFDFPVGKYDIVTNPPYGERMLEKKEAEDLFRAFGKAFRQNVPMWKAYIINSHEEFEKCFGKRADKVRKLYNGMIKCYLYQYFKTQK
jgi:hypothetical protein